jgi:hypothetical protein
MAGKKTPVTNLNELVRNHIDRRLGDVHTSVPGVVQSYDADKQTASVQVAIKRKSASGESLTVPIIRKVPVVFPRSGKFSIHFPLEKGDRVVLLFSERSLDNWKAAGNEVAEPADVARFFDYSDAVAMPGLYPDLEPIVFESAVEKNGLSLQSDQVRITITSDGKILAGEAGATPTEPLVLGNVLKTMLDALISEMKGYSADLQTGPVGVGNAGAPVPAHPTLIAAWVVRDANLDTLKSQYIDTATSNILSQINFTERGGA